MKGRLGDSHLGRRRFLLNSFQIFQSDSFQFFNCYTDLFEFRQRYSSWLEERHRRLATDPPMLFWPWHNKE